MALASTMTLTAETERCRFPQEIAVRAHLTELLRSQAFASSPRLRQFLTFIVERTLEGDEDGLKEYVIATTVYGRDVTYDPQIDSTVRVEASRLRKRLQEFYENEGRNSTLEIQLPKGRYVPVFAERRAVETPLPEVAPATEPELPVAAPRASNRSAAWLSILASVLAGLALWRLSPQPASASVPLRETRPEILTKFVRAQRLLRTPVLQNGWPGKVPPSVSESIQLFREVTAADPHFARAWVGLAEAEEWAYELNGNQPAAAIDRSVAALQRAVQMQPTLAEAWSRLSSVYFHRLGNRALAESAARRAIELDPKDVVAAVRLIDLLRIRGEAKEAARLVQRAIVVEPANPKLWLQRALLAYDESRYEEAMGFAEHTLGLFSGKSHPVAWWLKGLCLERLGRLPEAEAIYRAGMAANPVESWNAPSLGYLMARTGRTKEAEEILATLVRNTDKGMSFWYQSAIVLTGLGRVEEAITWLERGRAAGDTSLPYIGLEKRFDRLRDHPRFRALMS